MPGEAPETTPPYETFPAAAAVPRRNWFWPAALAVEYVLQVLFRLSMVTGQDYPVVSPDEQMYLVLARVLAGRPTTEIPGNEVIPGGYPLLISPAFRLSDDPVQVYHLIMGINALVSCLVLPLAYVAVRRLGVPRPVSCLIGTGAVMLPPVVFYSQYAMADTPLPVLVLAWLIGVHGLFSDGAVRRRTGFGLLAGAAAGCTLLVHDRGGVVVALTIAVMLAALVRGWAPRRATAASLAAVAALFAAKQAMTGWLVAHVDGSHPSAVRDAVLKTLSNPALYRRTVMRTVGHVWYLVTCTWGIAALVLVVCAVCVFSRRSPLADRVAAFLMVSLMSGIAVASAAGLPNDHRIDTIVYARYLSPLVPVFFAVGLSVLHRLGDRRRLALLGTATVGLTALITATVVHMASAQFHASHFILWALPDATFLASLTTDGWRTFHALRTTAAALAVVMSVLLIRLAAGRRTMAASMAIGLSLTAFAGLATISITDHVTRPNTAWRHKDATGFLTRAQLRPGETLVMDSGLRWETRMTLAFEILRGRVWTRRLTDGENPPAGADAAAFAMSATDATPEETWPHAPGNWYVAVADPKLGFAVWRHR